MFAVLAVAEELGVTHLKRTCHENIESTLSISNACGFYAAALQMEDELQYHGKTTLRHFSFLCLTHSLVFPLIVDCKLSYKMYVVSS